MKYLIRHGSTASVIYCNDFSIVGGYECDTKEYADLPDIVRDVIQKQFDSVFAKPYAEREAFIKTLKPFEVVA